MDQFSCKHGVLRNCWKCYELMQTYSENFQYGKCVHGVDLGSGCLECVAMNDKLLKTPSFAMDTSYNNKVALKDDGMKARFDLIPVEPLEALAELYAIGAKKYGDRNWEQGFKWGRVFAALMRHAWAWWRGEKFDPKDGQHHMIAVAWNAFSLYYHELHNLGEDDRSKINKKNNEPQSLQLNH